MSVYWASSAKLDEESRTQYYGGTSHNIGIAHHLAQAAPRRFTFMIDLCLPLSG
ncbi:hypothetical protein MGG_16434 [Pyricularia oryzae 70-15]|nr:uncharacterized protein MGG_16434 [Pyricularia oryzae 70-15]EHA57934.1 hypothetical protein MGG_16434 [Pyricularia oryzae 70-15]